MGEISSNLTSYRRRSDTFIVNFEHISHIDLVFPLFLKKVNCGLSITRLHSKRVDSNPTLIFEIV